MTMHLSLCVCVCCWDRKRTHENPHTIRTHIAEIILECIIYSHIHDCGIRRHCMPTTIINDNLFRNCRQAAVDENVCRECPLVEDLLYINRTTSNVMYFVYRYKHDDDMMLWYRQLKSVGFCRHDLSHSCNASFVDMITRFAVRRLQRLHHK